MSNLTQFEAWPKIPRLSKTMVVTEKVDGTNAAVVVRPLVFDEPSSVRPHETDTEIVYPDDGQAQPVAVYAQSRNRVLTPGQDNAGFGSWVHENATALANGFKVGRHFGEWWGQGIQRGYEQDRKWFSPFNSSRWDTEALFFGGLIELGVTPIPVLAVAPVFDTTIVDHAIDVLVTQGSMIAPGFKPAEGVIVYHAASGQLFKRLIENDDLPKSVVANNEQFALA